MSDFQHKPNSGSIFKNDKREKDTQPQMKGSALIDGVEYWVSAWTNESNSGTRYQSLSFQPKDQAHSQGMAQAQTAAEPAGSFDEDSIPF